jgi:Transketolase, thiamine diphosphate binding domain
MLSQGFLATVHRHTRHLCVPGQGCLPISEGLAIAWRVDITPITGVAVLAVDCWLHSGAAFDGVSVAPAEQRYEERYEEATCAYGWNVEHVGDANDTERLAQAFESFRRTENVPTLIIVESHIGYGAPHKQDTSAAQGEPLDALRQAASSRSEALPYMQEGQNSWRSS